MAASCVVADCASPGCTQCQDGELSVTLSSGTSVPVPAFGWHLSAQRHASASLRLAPQCPAPRQCQPSAGTSVPSASLRLAPQCPAPRQCQPSAGTSVPSATPVPGFFFLLQVITDLFLHTITCHTGAHSHAQRQPAHSLGAREKAPLPPGYLCAEAFLRAMPLVKVYLHNCLLTWWT